MTGHMRRRHGILPKLQTAMWYGSESPPC